MSLELDVGKHVLAMTGEIRNGCTVLGLPGPCCMTAKLEPRRTRSTWGPTAGSGPRKPAAADTKTASFANRVIRIASGRI